MNYFVNLKPYFNYRLVYPKNTVLSETDYIAVHNYFYYQEDFVWGKVSNHEAAIKLDRTDDCHENGFCDCIECEGQVIEVHDIECDKIIIAGVCAWGYYNENFKVEFTDGTCKSVPVFLKDWACPPEAIAKSSMERDGAEYMRGRTLVEFKRKDGPCYVHYVKSDLDSVKKVRRIIFPDNICMYIFGITLERSRRN